MYKSRMVTPFRKETRESKLERLVKFESNSFINYDACDAALPAWQILHSLQLKTQEQCKF